MISRSEEGGDRGYEQGDSTRGAWPKTVEGAVSAYEKRIQERLQKGGEITGPWTPHDKDNPFPSARPMTDKEKAEEKARNEANFKKVAEAICAAQEKEALDQMREKAPIRLFETGATRDTDAGKNDYEGYLSPIVLEAYGDYMTAHRRQSDGTLRDSANWQKGIPISAYRASLIRHVFTAWALWRGWTVPEEMIGGVKRRPSLMEALNGILFNTMGMMHEILRDPEQTEQVG